MSKQVLSGYLIHRRPYRETSLLIDFFTAEQGRVCAVAKGARSNTKSNRKSILQALQKIEFECFGRSSLKNLGHAEVMATHFSLKGKALYAAMYINELLQRALPESEVITHLFEHYEQSLQSLSLLDSVDNLALEPILRRFELLMLDALGHLPDLGFDVQNTEPVQAQAYYQYFVEQGVMPCLPDARHAIQGKVLLQITALDFSTAALPVAKYIARMTLPLAIGSKEIKSRELFT